jgi:hypothetical protein
MITEITATGEPIDLDQARGEVRDPSGQRDDQIRRHLTSAIRYVERSAGITLRTTVQRKLSLPSWPDYSGDDMAMGSRWPVDAYRVSSPISLLYPIWASTDSVKYFDVDDTETTVTATNYNTRGSDTAPAQLEFDEDYVFPTLRERADAVNITYTTGSATPDPVGVSAALLMLHFFLDQNTDAKKAADELLESLRLFTFGAP